MNNLKEINTQSMAQSLQAFADSIVVTRNLILKDIKHLNVQINQETNQRTKQMLNIILYEKYEFLKKFDLKQNNERTNIMNVLLLEPSKQNYKQFLAHELFYSNLLSSNKNLLLNITNSLSIKHMSKQGLEDFTPVPLTKEDKIFIDEKDLKKDTLLNYSNKYDNIIIELDHFYYQVYKNSYAIDILPKLFNSIDQYYFIYHKDYTYEETEELM